MKLNIDKDVIISKQLSLGDIDVDSVLGNCYVVYDEDGTIYFVDKYSKVALYSIQFRNEYLKDLIKAFENGEE